MRTIARLMAVFYMLIPCGFLLAQSTSTVTLQVYPPFPERNEAYEVRLQTGALADERSSIVWFVDGAEDTGAKNSSTLQIEAGEDPAVITARVTLKNGTVYERSYTRNPYRVDIIANADTSVPAFYKGRALPSSGSTMIFTALVFKDNTLLQSDLSYRWKINDAVQNGGALVGNNHITYIPEFESTVSVTVDVLNTQGVVLMSETAKVPVVKPELYFYEKNPLRGLSLVALKNPYIFVGEEMTIRAEPYFVNTNLLESNAYTQWLIDGNEVASNAQEKNEISIRKEGNAGSSELMFHIRNLSQLLQGAKNTLTIQF